MHIELYPPGGGDPVKAHPAKVEQMKRNGWKEKPSKVKATKEEK